MSAIEIAERRTLAMLPGTNLRPGRGCLVVALAMLAWLLFAGLAVAIWLLVQLLG